MNSELKMLFFRGGRRQEQLLLNGSVIEQPVAKVICSISQLEEAFLEKVKNVPEQINKIADDYQTVIKNTSALKKDDVSLIYLRRVKKYLDSLFDLELNADEKLIMQLLVYFPCYEAYSQAYDASERILTGRRQLNEIHSKIEKDNPQIKEFEEALEKGAHVHTASTAWYNFIALMVEDAEYGYWEIAAKVIFDKTEIYRGYAKRFEACVLELRKLKKDLRYAWDESDDGYTLSELKEHLMGPRVIPRKSDNIGVFPAEVDFVCKGEIYGIDSFTELIMAELNLLDEIDRPIRKCKLCGQPFVPYQMQAVYCQNQNSDYNNQTCAKVGSQMKYRDTHAFLKTPLGRQYLRNYNAYNMWADRNKAFVLERISIIYSDVKPEDREKIYEDIEKDINDRQRFWRDNAKKATEMFSQDEISEEEFCNRIKLPAAFDRSPLMAKLNNEWRTYNSGI